MLPGSLLERLTAISLVRRLADISFGHYAARRTRQLDGLNVRRAQERILFRLVRHAKDTRFGWDHGFDRVRSVADYQQRVPLRDYEAFWTQYWQPAFPSLVDATWPGRVPYFALSSGTTSGATKYVPVSRQMLASNRKAALTNLSLFLAAYPRTPLFAGRIFFLGGSTALHDMTPEDRGRPVLAGDLSGIAAREVPSVLRPFTFPPLDLALLTDWEQKLDLLARRAVTLPVTVLGGVPSWLLVLFDRLREVTGKDTLRAIWPTLQLVIHGGTKFDPYRPLFDRAAGSPDVRFLETYPASEGFIATEDPRYGLLRLIPDHDLFFEFVPVEELDRPSPTRHTADRAEPGVQYAVVLTTCAGLWAYVIGDTVCFEKRDPPLLRFTGRTRYYLSAFGEHLISEEVERAVAQAAEATGAAVVDFHVGPVFPESSAEVGRHRYLVEFADAPADLAAFGRELDRHLRALNEDYDAHRKGDLTMRPPEVVAVPRGGFARWMRSKGKYGGQHKVPRMDNTGTTTADLVSFFAQ